MKKAQTIFGKPCPHHGVVPRFVSNGKCIECVRETGMKRRKPGSTYGTGEGTPNRRRGYAEYRVWATEQWPVILEWLEECRGAHPRQDGWFPRQPLLTGMDIPDDWDLERHMTACARAFLRHGFDSPLVSDQPPRGVRALERRLAKRRRSEYPNATPAGAAHPT